MRFAYPAVLLCAAACASAPAASRSAVTSADLQASAVSPTSTSPLRGHIVTGSFMTEYYSGETLYDVLRRRLPLYLRPRSAAGAEFPGRGDPVAVYINGAYSGSLDVLNLIPASEVFAVERMAGSEAIIRFGQKHNGGALLVTLTRR